MRIMRGLSLDWRVRFFDRLEKVKALGFDDRFIKMWDFYLCYCAAGFQQRHISDVHLLMIRPNQDSRLLEGASSEKLIFSVVEECSLGRPAAIRGKFLRRTGINGDGGLYLRLADTAACFGFLTIKTIPAIIIGILKSCPILSVMPCSNAT